MSIPKDHASAMASEEDTPACAGEVVTSSRPEENPILSQIPVVEPGDSDDPDDQFYFTSATCPLM